MPEPAQQATSQDPFAALGFQPDAPETPAPQQADPFAAMGFQPDEPAAPKPGAPPVPTDAFTALGFQPDTEPQHVPNHSVWNQIQNNFYGSMPLAGSDYVQQIVNKRETGLPKSPLTPAEQELQREGVTDTVKVRSAPKPATWKQYADEAAATVTGHGPTYSDRQIPVRLSGPALPLQPEMKTVPLLPNDVPQGTPFADAERRYYMSPKTGEQISQEADDYHARLAQAAEEYNDRILPRLINRASANDSTPDERSKYEELESQVKAGKLYGSSLTSVGDRGKGGREMTQEEESLYAKVGSEKEMEGHPVAGPMMKAVQDKISDLSRIDQLAMLAALPESRMVSAYFGAQMGKGAVEGGGQVYEDLTQGDRAKAVYDATSTIVDATMAGLGARHALHGIGKGIRDLAHDPLSAIAPNDPDRVQEYRRQQAATRAADAETAAPPRTVHVAVDRPPRSIFDDLGFQPDEPTAPSNEVAKEEVAAKPIGVTDPETGRPTLHTSTDPEVIQEQAKAEHPAVKDAIRDITRQIEGTNLAGDRDEKDAGRLEEKMQAEGQSPETARDYSGYRIAVDSPAARENVAKALRQRFEVHGESDEFDEGDPENGFHAHVMNVREPGSDVTHEVQILPKEAADSAEELHPLYEKAREGDADAMAKLKAANEGNWKKFQERNGATGQSEEPKYKYGSTQHNIPDGSPAAKALDTARQAIPDADLAGQGKDIDGNHVTVRYGLENPEDAASVRDYLAAQKPFDATLGRTEVFPPSENSDGAAVVHAPVISPELTRINSELGEHGKFTEPSFAEYKPHATVAYVKPELADKYSGMAETEGAPVHVDRIAISDRDGKHTEVQLGGGGGEVAAKEPVLPGMERHVEANRESAEAEQGKALTAEMHQPAPSIEKQAGEMERNSPLFSGTEANPQGGLFGTQEPEVREGELKPNQTGTMKTVEMKVDPKRFQYKLNTDSSGTTSLLKGRKWNPDLAGVISAWRDPADGKVYVVNGHHRFELARANGVGEVTVRMLDARNAGEARAIGALQNIAEGRGTAVDAAKFFRDTGLTPEDLDGKGISLGEATAANGMALARLDQRLFDDVVSGKLRMGRAIAIGDATDKAEQQEAILKLIDRAESKGRKVSDDTVEELARMVKGSAAHTETQQTLFGAQEMTRNLTLEKAEVSSYIRDQIGKEKRLFSSVADEGKAQKLAPAGNKLDVKQNAAIAESAAHAQELYDKLSTRTGAIDEILNQAAQDLAAGKETPNAVKSRAYEAARKSLSETLAGGQESGAGSVQSNAGRPEADQQRSGGAPRRTEAQPAETQRSAGAAPAPRKVVGERWEPGTHVLVRDPKTGAYRAGKVAFFNHAENGGKRGGRLTMQDGSKLDNVAEGGMLRVQVPEKLRKITPITGSPAEKAVIERVLGDFEGHVARYLEANSEHGIPVIATDAAKAMFPEFKADPTGADRDTAAAASAINKAALATVLAEPVNPEKPEVQIMTASPGSGKTQGNTKGPTMEGTGIKVESIMDGHRVAAKLLNDILDSGRQPVVNWVYVDDVGKTVDRMFRRAIGKEGKPGIGRTVQLNYMMHAYQEVPRVLERLKEEFGDRIFVGAADNSGLPGESTPVTADIQPYVDAIKAMGYNEIKDRVYEKRDELQNEGLFDSDLGKRALEAADTTDRPDAQNPAGIGSGDNAGSVGRGAQGRAGEPGRGDESPLLDTPNASNTAASGNGGAKASEPGSAVSVSGPKDAEFRKDLEQARARDGRGNAESHKAEVIDTPNGKAVQMDADAYALWHRYGLGEKIPWRGLSMPKRVANEVIVRLRAMAGSARTQAGGAAAGEGLNRLVKALTDARAADGSVTLLRGDYRPDTVREEGIHAWQREHDLTDSEAMREVARRPEFKDAAESLREMGYGKKGGQNEIAAELMAKALAGDRDMGWDDDQRAEIASAFLSAVAEERGQRILESLPDTDPGVKAAVDEARRSYDYGHESVEGGGEPEVRRGNDGSRRGDSEASRLRQDTLHEGRGRGPEGAGGERRARQAEAAEGQLDIPLYQRANGEPLPFEEIERDRDKSEAADRAIDERIDAARKSGDEKTLRDLLVDKEKQARLRAADQAIDERIAATKAAEAGKPPAPAKEADDTNPVARSIASLVEDLGKQTRNDNRTALDKVGGFLKGKAGESLDRSGKSLRSIPRVVERGLANTKLVFAALVDGFKNPLRESDWKQNVGQMQLARYETGAQLKDLAKELFRVAPDKLTRVAMSHWIEAGGDAAKLKTWASQSIIRAENARNDLQMDARLKDHLKDSVEHYDAATKLTPEQKEIAQRIKTHFDEMLEQAQSNGLLQHGARNYVRHLYEKADAANLLRLIDTSELNPDPSFIKQRVFRTYFDAENHGMIPRNKDVGYLVSAYDKSMSEALASRTFLRSLLDAKARDGRPLAAIRGRGKWVIARGDEMPQVLEQRERPKSLEGYRTYDLPQARGFLFEPTTEDLEGYDAKLFEDDPGKLAFQGDLMFHPEVAGRVEDMLTPGWFDRNESAPQKVGHAIMKGSSLAKELMTAVAPFHMVQEGVHAVEHGVNPFHLPDIDLKDKTQRLLASNGLSLADFDAEGLFSAKALRGLGEGVPGVNVAMDGLQSFSRWQFEDYIPRLKMKMAVDAFERNVKRYPKLSGRQVAELTAKESNAAFGNLNTSFDAIHRSKTFKQLLRLSLFAPDFLEARMRFVGQAFTRYGGEQRLALVRGALVMYAVSRITNALLNQGDAKWDPEHAFAIVKGDKSFSLRTVQGDILHAVTDPRGFIYNRMNPLTTRPVVEFLSGRDQFGRQKRFSSQAKDLAKSTLPFGIQKVIQTGDEGWLNSILTSTGLEAKNYRTPAEEMTHKLYLSTIPDLPDDEEREAASRKHSQMEQALREGHIDDEKREDAIRKHTQTENSPRVKHITPADVWAKVRTGEISAKQAARTIERSNHTRLENEFSALRLKDAMHVFAKANPVEQMALTPLLAKKGNLLEEVPVSDRAAMTQEFRGLLTEARSMHVSKPASE